MLKLLDVVSNNGLVTVPSQDCSAHAQEPLLDVSPLLISNSALACCQWLAGIGLDTKSAWGVLSQWCACFVRVLHMVGIMLYNVE